MTRAASLQDGLHRLATLLGAPPAVLLIAVLDAPTVLASTRRSFGGRRDAGAVLVRR